MTRTLLSACSSTANSRSAYAGSMHLDSEEVALRVPAGKVRQMLAVAETDLECAGRIAPEASHQIQHGRLELEAEAWPRVAPGRAPVRR